ncbi:MAG TPA: ABC transporter permease [Stellaceae bacterium]|nr:ABC transporter permease [Stellaceae bacterium]
MAARGDRAAFVLLVTPALLLSLAFYFWPLSQVLWISVTEPSPGLGNYAQLFTSASIAHMLATTLRICAVTTVVTLVLGYVVAYALVHARPLIQRAMMIGVLLPLWVSVLVRAFAWIALLRREGVVNSVLLAGGLIDRPLPMIWNEFGVILGMTHYMLPYAILPLAVQMRQIDSALSAAARGLGAGAFETFWRVFLPLSLPGLVGAGVLVLIFSLGFYVTPVLLGGGRTLMVAEYISLQILELLRWGTGTMLATTLVLTILLALGVLSRLVDLRQLFGAK